MRILVLGGTSFVGRAIVMAAAEAGDEPTLFNRGRSAPDLFPQLQTLVGDRASGDYSALTVPSWDAVVDVSGYVPRHVQQASAALSGRVGRYLFISTGSVYDHTRSTDGMAEDSPRLAPIRDTEDTEGGAYGPLKVACEDDVLQTWGAAATIVRPGVVAGPHDPTDRFTWYVRAAARGGRVELPGRPDQPVQVVDSRDLAHLVLALLHDDRPGIFNAVGPAEPVTLSGLLQAAAATLSTQVTIEPLPDRPGFPLVLPDPSWDSMFRRSAARAHAAGMPRTPLASTVRDVRNWDLARGEPDLTTGA